MTREITIRTRHMVTNDPLRSALEETGHGVDHAGLDGTGFLNMPGEAETEKSILYRHSEELLQMIRTIECGERLRPVTLVIDDERREITLREDPPEEETVRFHVDLPGRYARTLESMADAYGRGTGEILLSAFRDMVMAETVHMRVEGHETRTLCLLARWPTGRENWNDAPPGQRCPECTLIMGEEK